MTSYLNRFWGGATLVVVVNLLMLATQESHGVKLMPSQYPLQIRLKAGVIHAPPMASVESMETTSTGGGGGGGGGSGYTYGGLLIDLLEHMKVFAARDGVVLHMDLIPSPPQYDDAFNLVANDCNTTENPNPFEDCERYDLIVGDFYSTRDRNMRAHLSPAWMKTSMTTIKFTSDGGSDTTTTTTTTKLGSGGSQGGGEITTLVEAEATEGGATVCVPSGTYLSQAVIAKFPGNLYLPCNPSNDECIRLLKDGNCILYADDELMLHHTALNDDSLDVSQESFKTQYMVFPMKDELPMPVTKLMETWIYDAIQNETLDDLYYRYYGRQLCPKGKAGLKCELPCSALHGAADSKGVCVCKSPKWTGDDCSIEVAEELNLLPPLLVNACFGLASFNVLLCLVCGFWLASNKDRAQVKIAQPIFLTLILLGCVISTSTIFFIAQQDDDGGPVLACAVIPWVYSVGFCLTFGAMFARIKRIHGLLQSAVEMRRVVVTAKETLMTVALILAIDVTILLFWTVLDPLEWKREVTSFDVFDEALSSYGYCSSEHWEIFGGLIASYHIFLMAVACYMCYLARKIPESISHGKYVSIAMFSNFQIFVIILPILVMLGSDNTQTSFFVKSAAIWINDLVVVSLIFGNLIYKVYKNDAESRMSAVEDLSGRQIRDDIHSFAKRMRSQRSKDTMSLRSAESGRNAQQPPKRTRISNLPSATSTTTDTDAQKPAETVRFLDPPSSLSAITLPNAQEPEWKRQQMEEVQQEAGPTDPAPSTSPQAEEVQQEAAPTDHPAPSKAPPETQKKAAQPTQKVVTFRNSGTDPTMVKAELYYESTPWRPLGHGDPPITVASFSGHRWFIVANGTYAKVFTIGEDAQQTFSC